MNGSIVKGSRVKVGRAQVTVELVAGSTVWFHDADGRYKCARLADCELVKESA